jgi:hypothetical protein
MNVPICPSTTFGCRVLYYAPCGCRGKVELYPVVHFDVDGRDVSEISGGPGWTLKIVNRSVRYEFQIINARTSNETWFLHRSCSL